MFASAHTRKTKAREMQMMQLVIIKVVPAFLIVFQAVMLIIKYDERKSLIYIFIIGDCSGNFFVSLAYDFYLDRLKQEQAENSTKLSALDVREYTKRNRKLILQSIAE